MWCLRDVTGEARMRDARDTTRVGLPARAMLLGLGIETIRCAAAAARPARHWHRIGSSYILLASIRLFRRALPRSIRCPCLVPETTKEQRVSSPLRARSRHTCTNGDVTVRYF